LNLHAIQDAPDISLDNRRRLGRSSGHTIPSKLVKQNLKVHKTTYLNKPLRKTGLKSLSC
jgi:hypothetical protein